MINSSKDIQIKNMKEYYINVNNIKNKWLHKQTFIIYQ